MLRSILLMGAKRRRGSALSWMKSDTSRSIWGGRGVTAARGRLWGGRGTRGATHPLTELGLVPLVLLLQRPQSRRLLCGAGGAGQRAPRSPGGGNSPYSPLAATHSPRFYL